MDMWLGTFAPPLELQRECEPSWNKRWKKGASLTRVHAVSCERWCTDDYCPPPSGIRKMFAYAVRRPASLRALVEIGGNEWLVHAITTEQGGTTSLRADITDDQWASMLSHPSLLDLRTKQLWLGSR